ncbi:TetR/AcrR family transcriptional regulator [Chitinimonas lacunae]|uniref:TetR/AcrR family transcriptional regulator n=1 Tax=Chitinimonas lacunae TaxID=1963018 RepID=A0ABV8ML05_9NEIS
MPLPDDENRLKPRKSPLQRRSVETVRVVLEAAARILERDGFAGYTTNAVAALAGVSVGSLYQYFPNRDAITAALIERETAQLLEDVSLTASAADFDCALLTLLRAAVTHQMRRPGLARLLDLEEGRLPVKATVRRVSGELQQSLLAILARPDAPPVEAVEVAAWDLLAMIKGMVDGAGERGEIDSEYLLGRVERAVRGYLKG